VYKLQKSLLNSISSLSVLYAFLLRRIP